MKNTCLWEFGDGEVHGFDISMRLAEISNSSISGAGASVKVCKEPDSRQSLVINYRNGSGVELLFPEFIVWIAKERQL